MTRRKVFGSLVKGVHPTGTMTGGGALRVWGKGQVLQTCGCCAGVAISWGHFVPELGITMPWNAGWKPLCSECRHGLSALGGERKKWG